MVKLNELTLDEMLADPIVHLMMKRDGVVEADVRALIGRILSAQSDGFAPVGFVSVPVLDEAA